MKVDGKYIIVYAPHDKCFKVYRELNEVLVEEVVRIETKSNIPGYVHWTSALRLLKETLKLLGHNIESSV